MAAETNRFERHARKVMIAVWLVALIAGLALVEWWLTPAGGRHRGGALDPGPGLTRHLVLREWRRDTDYQFRPTEARTRHPEGGLEPVYSLSTDSEGFIEPARRRKPADVSIVFLGGSTTECMYVRPESRFPHLAARMLGAALGVEVDGINAGLSGNNSMHALVLLLGKVVPLRPDFVVLMEAANDLGTLSAHGSYWVREGSLRLVEEERRSVGEAGRMLARALLPYTSRQLAMAWKSVRGLWRTQPARAAGTASAGANAQAKAMADAYESSLRSFVRVARAWGITPVLMTQVVVEPRSERERQDAFLAPERLAGVVQRPEVLASVHDRFNAIVREVARSEGAILVDLAAARSWAFGDVYDALHFTDRGSERVAEIVAAALKEPVAERAGAKRAAGAGGRR